MSFYRFARAVVLSICKVVFRVRVVGRENVPRSGAYIVAPSHRSILDVPFSAFITKRTIRFLAKDELFANRFGDKLFTALGAVRVERGTADRAALRALESRAGSRRTGRGVPRRDARVGSEARRRCSTGPPTSR